jgi:class 3 adenylate cyclase/tetratricopeptide (TPR) repeat protein
VSKRPRKPRALTHRCPQCGAATEPSARFCAQCGASLQSAEMSPAPDVLTSAPLAAAQQPGQYADALGVEERRIATILFADLAGFTSLSEELDPEDVKALAAQCANVMSAEVQRFGGTVTGIMGDAIMGTFGAPIAHEDDAERAIRAALAMRERIRAQELGPHKLDLHVGINTGETMAGLIGPHGRQDYTAMGDTTNTAARLMSHAPTGSIYAGEQTYLATRQSVVYRQVASIAAKGKREPVGAWEVLEAPPVPQARPLGTAPFVGRSAELSLIVELWERVCRRGEACSLTVVGPAGIGKTRLLREATAVLEGQPAVLWGRCLPYGEGITYWPLMEMLWSAAGIAPGDDLSINSEKLGRLIESLPTDDADQIQPIATALSNLLALPKTPGGVFLAAHISQGELHWGLQRAFELLAASQNLVLVFEDLHWSEPTLFGFIQSLVQSSAPILVLTTIRPEGLDDRPPLAQDDGHRLARLAGLTDNEASMILVRIARADGDAKRLQPLLKAAGGNPLFLEETMRMLASTGMLAPEGSDRQPYAEIPIPTSIQGLIGARLDLLPSEQKRLAQHGSVLGLTFWSAAVRQIGGWDHSIEPGLDGLVLREVVEARPTSELRGEHEFAFRHILIRDVAYRRLPKGERAILHGACAGWLGQHPGGGEALIEIIAYHLEQACRLAPTIGPMAALRPIQEAVGALVSAAARAEHRDGAREANRFYSRALELTGIDPETTVDLRIRRARTMVMLGELSAAASDLEAAADQARQLGRADLHGQALVTLANISFKEGRATHAGRCLAEAQAIAQALGDRWLQVRTAYELSALRGDLEGNADSAIHELREAIVIAEELGDLSLSLEGHLRIGSLLFNIGKLADAERESALVAKLAAPLGSNRDKGRATFLLALVTFYRTGPQQARRLASRALKWTERVGDSYFQVQCLRTLAQCDLATGASQLAETRLRQALAIAEASGGWLVVEICRYLVEALLDLGRVQEAGQVAAYARSVVPPEADYANAAALLAEAMVIARGTDPASAWKGFVDAIDIMESQQLWLDLGEARMLQAHALARDRQFEEARDALGRARALFARLDANAQVEAADRALARMSLEVTGPA